MLRRTLTIDRGGCPQIRIRRTAVTRRRKKPLIDADLSNIYQSETFRQHFGALLTAIMIAAVGRSGRLAAPDALAVLPNDAR